MKTLSPAYGRDYRSAKAVIEDYKRGKDFILQPQGCYCSIQDFKDEQVGIRYNRLTRQCLYTPK